MSVCYLPCFPVLIFPPTIVRSVKYRMMLSHCVASQLKEVIEKVKELSSSPEELRVFISERQRIAGHIIEVCALTHYDLFHSLKTM